MFLKPFCAFYRYEEAREEEKLRSQREDFSDMVAEVCGYIISSSFFLSILPYISLDCWFRKSDYQFWWDKITAEWEEEEA